MAGRQGFEPRFHGPEPRVLPLNDLPATAAAGRNLQVYTLTHPTATRRSGVAASALTTDNARLSADSITFLPLAALHSCPWQRCIPALHAASIPAVGDVADWIAVGGWPGHLERALTSAEAWRANRDYLDEIRRVDLPRVDGANRDPNRIGRLLRSLARNVATQASVATMAADAGGADAALKAHTAQAYLSALARLMIVEDQPAWTPHLRSRATLRSTPKRHLVDPSLAVSALRATPDRLLGDLNLLGLLFESLVVRDLRIYAQANDSEVLHYRDNTGLEVDAVVQAADGRWAAFEIKLGPGRVDEGARNLLKFAERVDQAACGAPSALAVIVAVGYGYERPDGVGVIPITALGP